VVDTGPPAFGLLALPVFIFVAPAGKLFAGWGALSFPLGAGGDWDAPLCAKADADISKKVSAGITLFMAEFPRSILPPP
jgi:hypothetical protein